MADSEADNSAGSGPIVKKAVPGKPFQPGQSGNPGGRSSERARLRNYITDKFGQESIDGIAELAAHASSEKVRLAAWQWLAEQTVGKAVQAISGADGEPVRLDVVSLMGALERIAGDK